MKCSKGSNYKSGWTELTDSLPHCLDLAPSLAPKWAHNDAFRLYCNGTAQEHLQKINSCQTGQRPAIFLSKFIAVCSLALWIGGWASHTFSSPGLTIVTSRTASTAVRRTKIYGVFAVYQALCWTLSLPCLILLSSRVQRFFSSFTFSHLIRSDWSVNPLNGTAEPFTGHGH